jgi:hypothetical protein
MSTPRQGGTDFNHLDPIEGVGFKLHIRELIAKNVKGPRKLRDDQFNI